MSLMDLIPPLSAPSFQVFAALLIAHVLADFLFQTRKMVENKGNVLVLGLHVAIVFALSTLALGGVWQVAAMVAAAHFIIDMLKVIWLASGQKNGLAPFLIDQAAHLMTLLAAALLWPAAMTPGWWADYATLAMAPVLLATGLIVTVTAGGMAVGLLTARYQGEISDDSLPDAGRLIGQLERFIIFVLVMIGEPAGIGFLIAAKSVLRFDTASQGQKASEYVIIGTLASFSWALVMAFGTQALLEIAAQAS